jgi:nitrite transporter NirC
MPIPVSDALAEQAQTAVGKVEQLRRPGQYLVSAMLAGVFVGVAVVLMVSVTGPLQAANSPWTKLVQGLVFAIALVAVVFAGAELSTGNMMTAVQGALVRRRGAGGAAALIAASFVGNLIGSAVFAALVYGSGVLHITPPDSKAMPALVMLTALVKSKAAESASALFFRGVLCNFLVCLAVWMATRTRSDGAKIALIFLCLLAFVGSGFEHVVANMTVFSLGLFEHVPAATLGAFGTNLLWVGLGNLVGGGLLVGVAYAYAGLPTASTPEAEAEQISEKTVSPATV